MPLEINININTQVEFVETERGRQRFDKYISRLNCDPAHSRAARLKKDGKTMRMPMWEWAMIYGPESMGDRAYIEKNTLKICYDS